MLYSTDIQHVKVGEAAAHNSIYSGKSLGTGVTDKQWAAIKDGTFEDMYIGDYWTINGTKYVIAAFDYYMGTFSSPSQTSTGGSPSGYISAHHITIVPDNMIGGDKLINPSYTITGYGTSEMFSYLADEYSEFPLGIVNAAFGSDHILKHAHYFNTGTLLKTAYPQRSLFYCSLRLLSERNVYGHNIYGYQDWQHSIDGSSSSYFTNSRYTYDTTIYPLFALNPSVRCKRMYWWLRDPVDAGDEYCSSFAAVGSYGNCNAAGSRAALGVVPGFEIYNP